MTAALIALAAASLTASSPSSASATPSTSAALVTLHYAARQHDRKAGR